MQNCYFFNVDNFGKIGKGAFVRLLLLRMNTAFENFALLKTFGGSCCLFTSSGNPGAGLWVLPV
jgi:hypothetical protein